MWCSAFLVVLFAATVFAVPVDENVESNDVVVIDDIHEYLAQNPSLKLLGKFRRDNVGGNIKRYIFGHRLQGKYAPTGKLGWNIVVE